MADATQLTPEEIKQYKKELAGNPKALEDIDLIERCDGDLEYSAVRLARRSHIEEVRTLVRGEDEEDFWKKIKKEARKVVCKDGIKDDLAPNIVGGLVGLFVTCGDPILVVVATPLAISIVRETLENFCD
ncbi:MAG: hypothetical protein AB4057_23255 [Crocosphaera sp.]